MTPWCTTLLVAFSAKLKEVSKELFSDCFPLSFSPATSGGCAPIKGWRALVTQETRIQETDESALEKGRALLQMTEGPADTEQTDSKNS